MYNIYAFRQTFSQTNGEGGKGMAKNRNAKKPKQAKLASDTVNAIAAKNNEEFAEDVMFQKGQKKKKK